MKKFEAMEEPVSRQESVPGPAKLKPGTSLETFQKSFQKKYDAAFAKFEESEELYKMEPTEENAAAMEVARAEAERQRIRLQKTENKQEEIDDSARITKERRSVKETVGKMADAIDAEKPKRETSEDMVKELLDIESARQVEEATPGYQAKPEMLSKKQKREAMHQSNVRELIKESGVEIPGQEPEIDVDVTMEAIDKAWVDRIKRDIEKEKTPKEIAKAALEAHPEESEKLERVKAGERIRAHVQAERAAAEMDPARKRSMAKLKKLEAEHEATGQRLRDLTGMSPEDAYEKLVLNGGFMQRMRRGLAKLANVPTYDLLDTWIESGKKMEEVDREIVGTEPDFGHEVRARGLRTRADEGMATKAAIGREEARRYREVPLDLSKPVGEVSDETLMEDVNAQKTKEFNEAIEQSRIELVAKAKAKADAERAAMKSPEEQEIENIEADFKKGVVRNAEGGVIEDEKQIRAKRPMSRVSGRRVSMSAGGSVVESMAKAESVPVYQPGEEAQEMPRMRKTKVEAPAEENELLKFQKERAADINVVRKEYPRAAEVWNSIATRLQGMEKDQLDGLSEIFGTRDIATAYVLDRAFNDMDGDKAAFARLQEADKILGIEEVSPKKVKAKRTNGKAA